ncbi:MAG: AraC family transcriptional regulator ligand-binding domain-containing protein [Pseudomonadota bacterium]
MKTAPPLARSPAADLRRSMPGSYFRQAFLRFGEDPAARRALLDGTGVSERDIAQGLPSVSVAAQIQQILNLNALVGEGYVLDTPPIWSAAAQGALDVAFRSAPTLGEGLELIAEYGDVRAPQIRIVYSRADKKSRLAISPQLELDDAVWRPLAEAAILSLQSMIETILSAPAEEMTVFWTGPAPAYADRLRQAFHGDVRFSSDFCGVEMPETLAAARSPYGDPALLEAALRELQTAKRALSRSSLRDTVTAVLLGEDGPPPRANAVADQLAMSRRTMERRLSAENTSFNTLRDEALKRRAERLIADPAQNRASIAAILGYEDDASFTRACKRWFGGSYRDERSKRSG